MRRLLKVSSASAAEAFLPRISCATRLSLRGLMRRLRSTASASVSCRRRGADFLPIALLPLRLLVRGVAVERAGRRELAELVPDHGDVSHRWLAAERGRARGLAVVAVLLVGARHRADRGHALAAHDADLTRAAPELGIALVAADQLDVGARPTRDLTALAGIEL